MKSEIVIDGEVIEFELDDFKIGNLSSDMTNVASSIAWWGVLKGRSLRERMMIDAHYRAWRATKQEQFCSDKKSKPSDSVIKAHIESDKKFLQLKTKLGICDEAISVCTDNIRALEKKANMLQSLGATNRVVYEKNGLTTKSKPLSEQPIEDENDDFPPDYGRSSKKSAVKFNKLRANRSKGVE